VWRALIRGTAVAGLVVVGAVAAITTWNSLSTPETEGEPPLIRAEERPFRVQPAAPGGLEIPDGDKLIYRQLEEGDGKPLVEQLLDEPEQPLPLPVPPETAGDEPPPGAAADSAAPVPQPPLGDETAPDGTAEEGAPAPTAPPAVAAVPVPAAPVKAPPATKPQPPAKGETTAKPPAPSALPQKATANAGGAYQVQIGALRSADLARAEWDRLKGKNRDLLGAVQSSVQRSDLGAKGVVYRLRAGPFDSEAKARSVCKALSGRGVGCIVVRPSG
jgi:cell division septation protein DedD